MKNKSIIPKDYKLCRLEIVGAGGKDVIFEHAPIKYIPDKKSRVNNIKYFFVYCLIDDSEIKHFAPRDYKSSFKILVKMYDNEKEADKIIDSIKLAKRCIPIPAEIKHKPRIVLSVDYKSEPMIPLHKTIVTLNNTVFQSFIHEINEIMKQKELTVEDWIKLRDNIESILNNKNQVIDKDALDYINYLIKIYSHPNNGYVAFFIQHVHGLVKMLTKKKLLKRCNNRKCNNYFSRQMYERMIFSSGAIVKSKLPNHQWKTKKTCSNRCLRATQNRRSRP